MSPNKDETAVHGCSSYLHCSYLGEAGCAHVCRFWPNRGVVFGWFVLFTVSLLICLQLISINCPKDKDYYLVTLLSLRFCSTIKEKKKKFSVENEKMVDFNF